MKKAIIYSFTITVLIFIVSSCSSPLDRKYSKDTFKADLEEIGKDKSLDSTSKQVLLGLAFASVFNTSDKLEGKTYREIIEEAKKKQAEEKALVEKARREEAEKKAKLDQTLSVAVYDKGFNKGDFQDYITYNFIFQNKGDKEIRAFKGHITFTDLFDKEIKTVEITYDNNIASKSDVKTVLSSEYNQFLEDDKLLASKSIKDLKTIWIPEKILFSDGTSLE